MSSSIKKLLSDKSGIMLDIACGANKQDDTWIGIDIQALPGVDIVHDINIHPWPLPDECVTRSIASHIVEHIPPVVITEAGTRFPFIEFMNEVWRVTKPGGEFVIACPHGASQGYLQDPTHCNAMNKNTWAYFDPEAAGIGSALYSFYRPKPWRIKYLNDNPVMNMEVILIKRQENNNG